KLTGNPLTIQGSLNNSSTSGTIDLNARNLSVTGSVTNFGTIRLQGNETVTLTSGNDTAHGTWTYLGTGNATGSPRAIKSFGSPATPSYYNLTINDPYTGGTPPTYTIGSNTNTVNGTLTISSGSSVTFDASSGNITAGNVVLTGG